MAKDMPLPAARGRAVSQDAARMRGVPSSAAAAAAPAAPPAAAGPPGGHIGAHQPARAQLRSPHVKPPRINVHINTNVHNAFAAFIDEYELPKGDAASLAIQEFLERRGVQIPGVARALPPPVTAVPNMTDQQPTGGDSASTG